MDKLEIIGRNDTSITEFDEEFLANLERVDFDNPMTILSYGSALLNEMSELMQNITKLMNNEETVEMDVNINEKIRSLGKFCSSLETVDKIATKNGAKKGLPGLIATAVDKVTSKKKEDEQVPTYYAEFESYSEKVDAVAKILENQKNSTLLDIDISKSFIEKFKPFIKKLEAVIKIGFMDRQAFIDDVINPLEIEVASNPDDDILRKQYEVAKQKIALFEDKLARLQETLITAKNTVTENQLSQSPNMQLVLMYESYIKNTIPALKIQAASIIQTKRQENKIAKHQLLVEVTNKALLDNSQQLKNNIVAVNKLSAEGNIKASTLIELKKNIGTAVDLVKKGADMRATERQKNMELLSSISSELSEYQREVDNVIASENFNYRNALGINNNGDVNGNNTNGASLK